MLSAHIAEALRASDHRIIVTGASGWLGTATLDLLHDALGSGFRDRVCCFGSQSRILDVASVGKVEQKSLDALSSLSAVPSLLLHFAFLTKDRAEQMDEAEYRAAVAQISKTVLESTDDIGVRAVFLASSGAAAFADDPTASPAMRLYGSMKREDEISFARWAADREKRLVLARIYNLSGPHINKVDSYALSSFLTDGLRGGPITVRAAHDVVRGYVAVRELMSLVFGLLLHDEPGIVRFDSGGDPVELGALAAMISEECGGVRIDRPHPKPGRDQYLGDQEYYRSLLRSERIEPVPLSAQIAETARFLSSL